jgi:hypothetical protein
MKTVFSTSEEVMKAIAAFRDAAHIYVDWGKGILIGNIDEELVFEKFEEVLKQAVFLVKKLSFDKNMNDLNLIIITVYGLIYTSYLSFDGVKKLKADSPYLIKYGEAGFALAGLFRTWLYMNECKDIFSDAETFKRFFYNIGNMDYFEQIIEPCLCDFDTDGVPKFE